MKVSEISAAVAEELKTTLSTVSDKEAEMLADMIAGAKRIFLTGAGRSLLMVKACAMRLMQLGFEVYVTGETVTPAITDRDTLIAVSGSGETETVVMMAKKAKRIGARIACLTIAPQSSLGSLSELAVKIDVPSSKIDGSDMSETVQLGGARFEISVLLLLEAVTLKVVEKLGIKEPNALLMKNHANLE